MNRKETKKKKDEIICQLILDFLNNHFERPKNASIKRKLVADRNKNEYTSFPLLLGVFFTHAYGVEIQDACLELDIEEEEYRNKVREVHRLIDLYIVKESKGGYPYTLVKTIKGETFKKYKRTKERAFVSKIRIMETWIQNHKPRELQSFIGFRNAILK